MSLTTEMARLVKDYRRKGWLITLTTGNHYKWFGPNGTVFFSAGSPSDFRAIKNTKARIKRAEQGRLQQ